MKVMRKRDDRYVDAIRYHRPPVLVWHASVLFRECPALLLISPGRSHEFQSLNVLYALGMGRSNGPRAYDAHAQLFFQAGSSSFWKSEIRERDQESEVKTQEIGSQAEGLVRPPKNALINPF